ncbi:hypothetical protein [Abyssisolibacter fermentans]|uniref:hypothetical protein n=1 Tax=Abyssisolibacter fermentans TaxID=1766203 RepID=UPI0008373E46|nr:hypothetical protein [Abyssisolibacter fermentans]
MSKINFSYPFILFEKCGCTNQVPILSMNIQENEDYIELKYELKCPVCGSHIKKVIKVDNKEVDLSNSINAFKVIPSIKDELALIKLDTFKAKLKEDGLSLYGNYTHLRFWDNKIQRDIIKVAYHKED